MITTSAVLQSLMLQALTLQPNTTMCGKRVWRRRGWPTQPDNYPCAMLRWRGESKRSLGRSGINFTVTSRVAVNLRVQVDAQEDDVGTAEAEELLQLAQRQVETAIVNYPPLQKLLQQVASVEVEADVADDGGKHLGEIAIVFALEFYQGVEDFFPIEQPPLTEVTLQTEFPTGEADQGVGFDLKLPQ